MARRRKRERGGLGLLVGSLLVVGAFVAWWSSRGTVRRAPGLDVLLISIDTLRADSLGAYGSTAAYTPLIDRLAREGVRFDFAHAHNVVTLPSHANILSGRYPFDHRVRENSGFRFPEGVDTLATLLKRQGYRTGAFVSAFPLDSRFGLDRGFDVYDDRLGDFEMRLDFQMQERPGRETVEAATAWLRSGSGPTFCFVHLYEPHAPYRPPDDWGTRFARAYDGEVASADKALQPLLDPILQASRKSRTLVVLTSDHGESLGEHGEATHGIFAYEATLRVPLVFFEPGLFSPRVVTESARHVDVLPTILDALALPIPEGLPGRSLLDPAQGRGSDGVVASYFEAVTPALTRGWAPVFGLLRDRHKYVELPIPEIYDLAKDPGEGMNLVAREPERLEQLRGALASHRSKDAGVQVSSESASVRERLAALGYVAAASGLKSKYSEDDDPKRNIGFETALQPLLAYFAAGDLDRALELGERLAAEHPGMALAQRHLAYARRQSGDLKGAVEAARHALSADSSSVESASQLGTYLNEAGRFRETIDVLAPYAQKPDSDLDVLTAYGAALAQVGRRDDALSVLEQARKSDPSSALVFVNIGTVHLLFGERAKARTAFEAALEREPRMARAYNSLGVIAAQEGQTDKAAELWKRGLEINPNDLDTLYNLGKLLWKSSRQADARPYLKQFIELAPPDLYRKDVAEINRLVQNSR